MSYFALGSVLRSYFETQWGFPQLPVQYDNMEFEPSEYDSWVRFTVIDGDRVQAAMGMTRQWRNVGMISISLFVPLSSGDGFARTIADHVADLFQGKTISGIVCRATSLTRVGADGKWLHFDISTPFYVDTFDSEA